MLKLLIKNNLLHMLARMNQGKKSKSAKTKAAMGLTGAVLLAIFLGAVFLFAFGSMAVGFGLVMKELPDGTWFYGAVAAVMGFLIMLIGTIFFATSSLFEAKDNELLLSMPIRPGQIVLSRLLSLLLLNYLYGGLILLPFGVVGGFLGLFSPLGLCLYFVAALFLPLFALAFTCLLSYGISAITARLKNPKFFQTVLIFAGSVLYMAFYIGMQNLATVLMTHADSLRKVLQYLYPLCLMGQVAEGSVLWCGGLTAICVLSMWLVWVLLDRSFIRLVTTKKTAAKRVYRHDAKTMQPHSPFSALVRRDIRRFVTTPLYLFNAGIGLLMTLGLSVLLLTQASKLPALLEELDISASFLIPFLSLGFLFMSAMTGISAPSLPLEGKSLWILRTSPLTGRDVLRSKAAAHIIVSLPFNLLSCILTGFALKTPLFALLLFLILTSYTAFVAYTGTAIATFNARFDYPSETAAIKQSAAVGYTMLIAFVGSLLLPAPGIAVAFLIHPLAGLVLQFVLCALAAFFMRQMTVTSAAKKFDTFTA